MGTATGETADGSRGPMHRTSDSGPRSSSVRNRSHSSQFEQPAFLRPADTADSAPRPAGFDRSNFEIAEGRPSDYRSSPHVLRAFCPSCGSTLTYRKDASGVPELEAAARLISIAVASLDDPALLPPDEVVHGQEKIGWMHFGEDIPVRQFISEHAGHLQFGGINHEEAEKLASRHIDKQGKDVK